MILLFERLLSLLSFEIDAFEVRLRNLAAEDYPSNSAPSLIEFFLAELVDQRARVGLITRDAIHDPLGALDRLRSEHRKLNLRFPFVSYLSGAQTRSVPWSLVPSIEQLALTLVSDRTLLTSCFEKFNYSIRRGESTDDADPFDILLIPAVHRLDAFLHIEIGHELFHLLVNPFLEKEQALILSKLRGACERYLGSGVQPFEKNRLDQLTEWARNVWRRAVEEIICDFGCVLLFGPAALMASVTLFTSMNLDAAPAHPRYYPPARLRWRKVLELAFGPNGNKAETERLLAVLGAHADLADCLQSLKDFWQMVEQEVKQIDDLKRINANPINAIAYAEIDESLKRGLDFAQSIVKGKNSSWATSIEEIPFHLRNLRSDIPCGELRQTSDPCGQPSSLAAIVNAAWINELRSQKSRATASANDAAESYSKACRLLLKSVEDAHLKKTFNDEIVPKLQAENK